MAILSPEMQGYVAVMAIFALVVPLFYHDWLIDKDEEDDDEDDDTEDHHGNI